MREIALFSGKIYTAGTNFTRPPVVTVATNLNSEAHLGGNDDNARAGHDNAMLSVLLFFSPKSLMRLA